MGHERPLAICWDFNGIHGEGERVLTNTEHAEWRDIATNKHLEDGSKQVYYLKQTWLSTGAARKYLTTRQSWMFVNVFLLNYAGSLREPRDGIQKNTEGSGLANYLLTVSLCSSWHCRLHSCPVWANNLANFSQPQLQGRKKYKTKLTRVVWHELGWYVFLIKSCLTHLLSHWVGCNKMRTACHTDLPGCYDWGLTMTRSLSVMMQLKHDHDTHP